MKFGDSLNWSGLKVYKMPKSVYRDKLREQNIKAIEGAGKKAKIKMEKEMDEQRRKRRANRIKRREYLEIKENIKKIREEERKQISDEELEMIKLIQKMRGTDKIKRNSKIPLIIQIERKNKEKKEILEKIRLKKNPTFEDLVEIAEN